MKLKLPALRWVLGAGAIACLGACAHWDADTIPPPQSLLKLEQHPFAKPANPDDLLIAADWWKGFGDVQLNQLIDHALQKNPSLQTAAARVARAQAVAAGVRGNEAPQVGLGADLTRQLFSSNFIYPPPLGGSVMETGTVQANATWELDIFGKNRTALEAAIGLERAAHADAQAARMVLASQVARTYFQWRKLVELEEVADHMLVRRELLHQLVQERLAAGLDTQLELQQSAAALPEARLQIEMLQEQRGLTLHALTALCGQQQLVLMPHGLPVQANIALAATKMIVNTQNTQSIPLDLLGRRADIVAARWRVEAAMQDVENAKTLFYPNINVAAFAGFQSIGFNHLLQSSSMQWGVGPAIRLPLFDGGHLQAHLRGKAADWNVAVGSYNTLVLDAVRDVADQLTSQQSIARQQIQQRSAQTAAEAAHAIAHQRYKAGLGTYLNVLSAETAVLTQRRQAVELAARAVDTQVQLIRALGGGV